MENKINIARFKEGYRTAEVKGIWQWDYGQILRIQGLNLPSAVEIHFSLDEHGGEAVRRIGVTKDGVTDVVVPDTMLENESAYGDSYYFFAYIYLTDETSGNTEYKIRAKVSTRSKPEGYVSGGNDTFAEILKTVNEIAEDKVDIPAPAKVGQVLSVKATDESGKPTEFEAKDMSGGVSDEKIANAVEEYMTTHPFTETDPTVPDWAKQPEKPSYTAEEVGALPNTTTTLPNPNALTFTGAVTGSYDGSSPIEINIPEGGGTGVTVDTTLSVAGQAADAKATGDAISSLSEEMKNKTGTGLSTEAIDKLEEVGNYLVYTTADGGSKWTELISILRNGSSGGGSGETVPATGISLDKTTLSFTDSATQTLVATVEPSDTTDKVVWTSNAESVAKVTNGVVKPLSNGSATITATCGSVSATCFVTVDIAEEEQVTLTSISATYTGGDVAVGTSLDDLTGITVTAHYSDGSTVNVTGYTLSGTIAEGSNTITVSYGGKTTTFTVIGTASAGETIVYNVFTGEYINSGYSGDNYTNYGANYNIYQEEIDVTDASTLYYRFGRNNKVTGATQSGLKLGVYSSDGSVLGVLDLSDSSTVTEVDGKYDINGLETLDDGTVIYGIYVASVSLSSFENKSYVKFAVLRSSKFVPRWNGNAQSTSALSLEV